MTPEWMQEPMQALCSAHAAGRLPHGLLIHEAPGAGGSWLASWAARLALCAAKEGAALGPCGECRSCRHLAGGHHPDLVIVKPEEDSKQLRIEQVRELGEELALTSHQGGYKVGILSPADALNRFAANALLKTLEEPPARTLLILVATQPSRLPATIVSRCQKLRVRVPTRSQSLQWLQVTRGTANWDAVLDVVGEAPFLAAELDPAAILEIGAETRRTLEDALAGRIDPVATAERWSKAEPALKLRCVENWLTDRIRRLATSLNSATPTDARYLPRGAAVPNIRELFELLDGVRELRSLLDTPINRALALESLLRRLEPGRA